MSTASSHLRSLIRFCFAFLILTLPLIWSPANSELFEFPKMMFVYAVTVIIASLWLARIVIDKQLHLTRTRLDPFLLLFLISQTLSTVFSIHPRTSIFGYYSRFHGGLLSTLAYITLYFAFVTHFTKKDLPKIVWVLILSLTFSVLYAFPEHFGYAFSCLSVHQSLEAGCWIQDIVNRSFGTFGQPNWLAAYIVTLFPLLWYSVLALKKTRRSPYFLVGFYLLQFLSFSQLTFTRSKSGLLGFAAAYVFFWVLTLFYRRRQVLAPLAISTSMILFSMAFFGSEYTPSLAQSLQKFSSPVLKATSPASPSATPQVGTVLDTGDLGLSVSQRGGTQSSTIRYIVWSGALELLRRYPILGTGVETFAYAYYNVRPANHNLVSEWDFLYNKAHNEFLNFAATTGLLGLSAYSLLILVYVFFSLRSYAAKSRSPSADHLSLALLSGFLGLAVSNFFGFSTVPVAVLFFLFPAIFSLSKSQPLTKALSKASTVPLSSSKPNPWQITGLIFVALVSAYLLLSLLFQYSADVAYNAAKSHETKGEVQLAAAKYQQALKLRPQEPTFYNDYADLLAKIAYFYATQDQSQAAARFAQDAATASFATLKANPVHLNFYKTQAGVFIRLSALEPSLIDQAQALLQHATQLSPTEAKLYYNLGLLSLDKEDFDTALTYFKQAVDLKPDYESARLELAKTYLATDQPDLAESEYRYVLEHLNPLSTPAQTGLEELASP